MDSADCNNKMYYFPEYKALPEWIFEEMKVRFNNCCPEYEEFLKKYNYVNEKYDNLKNEIQKLETLETDLKIIEILFISILQIYIALMN